MCTKSTVYICGVCLLNYTVYSSIIILTNERRELKHNEKHSRYPPHGCDNGEPLKENGLDLIRCI